MIFILKWFFCSKESEHWNCWPTVMFILGLKDTKSNGWFVFLMFLEAWTGWRSLSHSRLGWWSGIDVSEFVWTPGTKIGRIYHDLSSYIKDVSWFSHIFPTKFISCEVVFAVYPIGPSHVSRASQHLFFQVKSGWSHQRQELHQHIQDHSVNRCLISVAELYNYGLW